MVAILLAMLGCSMPQDTPLYMARPSSEAWGEDTPLSVDVLFPHSGHRYSLELMLRFDGRVDSTMLALELTVLRRGIPVHADTAMLTLADRPGHWAHPRIAVQEVDYLLPTPIAIPYAGLYQVELRPLRYTPISGVLAVGLKVQEL